MALIVLSTGDKVGSGAGSANALRRGRRRGDECRGGASGGGIANLTVRNEVGEGVIGVEADSDCWLGGSCTGGEASRGAGSSWGADGSAICSIADTWAGGGGADSE